MSERIDILHRRYRIIAGDRQSGPTAIVYDGAAKLYEANGPTVAAVLQEARGWIDQLLDGQRTARRLEHVGTVEEYCRVFRTLKLGRHHEAMLRAHANASGQMLTATELARAAGYDGYEAANAHYGRLGRQVAEFLNMVPPINGRHEPVWTEVLASGDDKSHDRHGHWRWKMHPEVATALRELNMA